MPATHTPNLNLNKPDRQDLVSVVTDINDNMDTIDGAIGALPSGHTVQGQINTLKPVSIVLNPVTNANGATTVVTQDSRINEGLKAVYIEVGTPETFLAPIRITTGEGQIELYCANAVGSSTVTVVVEMATVTDSADPQPASVTSTEFDILANRIGTLSQLTTTQKTNVVGAINEINGKLRSLKIGGLFFGLARSDGRVNISIPVQGSFTSISANKYTNISGNIYGSIASTQCTFEIQNLSIAGGYVYANLQPNVTLSSYTDLAKITMVQIGDANNLVMTMS